MALFLIVIVWLLAHWHCVSAPNFNARRKIHFRAPRSLHRSRTKPVWVRDAIINLKARLPEAGCRTVAHLFNRRHAPHMTISKSCVADLVRQNRYAIENRRRLFKQQRPQELPCNQVWGIDFTGKQDSSGGQHSVLGIIDHGSRHLRRLIEVSSRNSWTLLGHLCLAIGRYGKPRSIRTDNEGTFTSRTIILMLRILGIRHQRTQPGCPWQNGRIERLFGTLKSGLDRLAIYDSLQLGQVLKHFEAWYNMERPHDHLAGATPHEAWHGIDPYRR